MKWSNEEMVVFCAMFFAFGCVVGTVLTSTGSELQEYICQENGYEYKWIDGEHICLEEIDGKVFGHRLEKINDKWVIYETIGGVS